MAQNTNVVTLSGNLTKDPDIRVNANNLRIARFTLAVNRAGKDGAADFISCVAFDKTAEILEKYTSKGRHVIVTGRIQTGSYTNRDGQKVYTTDVVANSVELCSSGGGQGYGGTQAPQREQPAQNPVANPVDSGVDSGFVKIPDDDDPYELPFN